MDYIFVKLMMGNVFLPIFPASKLNLRPVRLEDGDLVLIAFPQKVSPNRGDEIPCTERVTPRILRRRKLSSLYPGV